MALVAVIVLTAATPIFALTNGEIIRLTGKVEVKYAGGDWQPAQPGMRIDTGVLISTGFRSTAVLELGDSTVNVRSLTRMTIDELVESEGVQNTSLSLRVGKVRAEVKTTDAVSHNFTIRSPTATAAVRGTVFEFDGESLVVEEGMVALANALAHVVSVGPNESSVLMGSQRPASAKSEKENRGRVTVVDSGPKGKGAEKARRGRGQGSEFEDIPSAFGEVIIEWN